MLSIIGDALTVATSLGIALAAVARFLPNEKLYGWGVKGGQFLQRIGSSRMGGTAWERLEDFLVNSIGEYLKGVKFGLDSDEVDPNKRKENDVRI